MNLLLCHIFDEDSIWLYLELRKLNVDIIMLAPEQIFMAQEWTQMIETGFDDFTLTVKDGPTFRYGDISFIFNRIQFVDPPLWKLSSKKDRDYVRSELTAFLMSWLFQIGRQSLVVNPPVEHSLCGVSWPPELWAKAAYDSGFLDVEMNSSSALHNTILVAKGMCMGGVLNRELEEKCLELSRVSQSPLLEIYLGKDNDTFIGATAVPLFRNYGKPFVDRIYTLVKGAENDSVMRDTE
jgi:hypothetical protein